MSLLANSNAIESGGYNIQRSLRFRSSASAYLSRTPAATSNQQKFTWSGWVKRGNIGSENKLFSSGTSASNAWYLMLGDNVADALTFGYWNGTTHTTWITTTQVFRDPSAWYHFVLSVDTTQATAANRVVMYVNGSQITSFGTATYPAQNTNTLFNTASTANYIGTTPASPTYFDGYLAEVNFIDGQALTPSSFGQTDAVTGVWQPKKYTGTYGTNGFYLPFSDNTSSTTLAYDKSGNGNNWTPNNISTTAGATYDSMTDVPTLTSATAANYCVLNPLDKNTSGGTVSNGNLQWSTPADSTNRGVLGSVGFVSGKWYWEAVVTSVVANTVTVGFVTSDWDKAYVGSTSTGNFGLDTTYGARASSGITISGSTVTIGLNDVISVAFDADSKTATFYKNNTSIYTFSNIPSHTFFPAVSAASNTVNVNFGQRPFSYTPPTGFKALNTFNLPDPVIKKPNQYMDATLYVGNGTSQNVVNAAGFQPDFVWNKDRSNAAAHALFDSVRGVTKELYSNQTDAEGTVSGVTSFNSNGYTVGANTRSNANGSSFVGWQWKESATAGFDIVTYTGDGTTPRNISHSLGVSPSMMIFKARSVSGNSWDVYHKSLGASGYLLLDSTSAAGSSSWLNNTAPTSSVFTLSNFSDTNANGVTYVAYLFAEIAGFSKFGSYTGNGSADGPFVYCGFRPKYVMVKRTDSTSDWGVYDSARDTYNQMTDLLFPNASYAETAGYPVDFLSNGFKMRNSAGFPNNSGGTFIFAAFAENPMKYSNAR